MNNPAFEGPKKAAALKAFFEAEGALEKSYNKTSKILENAQIGADPLTREILEGSIKALRECKEQYEIARDRAAVNIGKGQKLFVHDFLALERLAATNNLRLKDVVKGIQAISSDQRIESFAFSDRGAIDISALADLTGLIKLSISNNKISDISALANLRNISELDISGNKIKDLKPLTALSGIKVLKASHNNISDLRPIKDLSDLRILDLDMNSVSDLSPLERLISLRELSCNYNKIIEIESLSELTNLVELKLAWNPVWSLPKLDKLYSLELLNLSWTQITDLSPLIKLSSLNRVELVGYKFSEFTSEHVIKNAQALGELRAKRIEVRTQ